MRDDKMEQEQEVRNCDSSQYCRYYFAYSFLFAIYVIDLLLQLRDHSVINMKGDKSRRGKMRYWGSTSDMLRIANIDINFPANWAAHLIDPVI
jgi:hypothetical protein